MRRLSFNQRLFLAAAILAVGRCACAQSSVADSLTAPVDSQTIISRVMPVNQAYEENTRRRLDAWNKLIPNMFALQYAGDIGMLSGGIGWQYGKAKKWETHLMLGFIPREYNHKSYATLTIREAYLPLTLRPSRRWHVRPLTVSLAVNSILDGDFWTSEPSRYPHGYYGFSSRIRFHLGFGQRVSYVIPRGKRLLHSRISLYYEVSTCDIYLRQKIVDNAVPWKDIITLGVGMILSI